MRAFRVNDLPGLASALKAARLDRGLRQDDLALAAGINRKTLMSVEGAASDRDPGLSYVMRVIHQLGLELVLQPASVQPNLESLTAEASSLGLRLEPRVGVARSFSDLAHDARELGFELVPSDVGLDPDAPDLALARRIAARRRSALAQLPDDPQPEPAEVEMVVDDGYGFDDDADVYAPRGMR